MSKVEKADEISLEIVNEDDEENNNQEAPEWMNLIDKMKTKNVNERGFTKNKKIAREGFI